MPAVSKAQQQLMGMAHAVQTGKFRGRPSKRLRDVAHSMSKEDVRDFAATKHEGLPEHVKNAFANMKKQATCTQHDPNTPTSFDAPQPPIVVKRLRGTKFTNKEKTAFVLGFVKAAEAQGFSTGQAIDLLTKDARNWWELQAEMSADAMRPLIGTNTLTGSAIGAGLGGLTGYFGGKNKQRPENDHSVRDAILGALGGGVVGGATGATGTMAYLANKHPQSFLQLWG